MATSLTINGVSYLYPDTGDQSWGTVASAWAAAVTTGMLQKAGGTFALAADANFGSSFGLISKYFTSQTTNAAASGVIRLANTESVAWRNNANGADILLSKDSSDRLNYAGTPFLSSGGLLLLASAATGVLPNANTTGTAAATASTLMLRDANINSRINSLISGFATTATAGMTTTLTVSSAYLQRFTGTTTQTVVLPDATTLVVGQSFLVQNRSTGVVTVNANGGGLIQTMPANSQATLTCTGIGSSAGNWDAQLYGNSSVGISVFTSSGTFTVPNGVTSVIVAGHGGGGGGGGGNANASSGSQYAGWGGSGAASVSVPIQVTSGAAITVTIGAGGTSGAGGSTNGSDGGTGGDSTFGSLWTFKGAPGGWGGNSSVVRTDATFIIPKGGVSGGGQGGPGSAGSTGAGGGQSSSFASPGGPTGPGGAGGGGGGGSWFTSTAGYAGGVGGGGKITVYWVK